MTTIMRPTLPKIAILVLAFGLGVGVSACWQLYQWSRAPQITIVGGVHACGATVNYHTMELSDGTRIVQSCEHFPLP